MDKLERLLNLTALLLDTRHPLTAEEIRHRLPGYPEREDSFRRAFERDKDDLREMGIPIDVEPVGATDPPVSGYRIRPDRYYLPDPDLTPEELTALQLAAVAIRLGSDDAAVDLDAVRKLGGREVTRPSVTEVASLPLSDELTTLFGAVLERRAVHFTYSDAHREVHPYRLDFHKGRWYLTGHDTGRAGERRFRLDRVQGMVEAGSPGRFERPPHLPGLRIEGWELGEGEPVTARLLVDAAHVSQARATLPDATPWEAHGDGSATASIAVVNVAAFRGFVLTFLDHAELLGPDELRDDLTSWLVTVSGGSE